MSVSKDWNQWIKSPLLAFHQSSHFNKLSGFFFQKQLCNPTFISLDSTSYGVPTPSLSFLPGPGPGPVDILSSCSGLLACHADDDTHYICNPATKTWTSLPPPLLYHGHASGTILAFDPSPTNIEQTYYLICAVPMLGCSTSTEVRFELYNSSSRSWRDMGSTLIDMMEDLSIVGPGFYMKGVAYWLTKAGMVIALNIHRDLHELIPIHITPPAFQISDGVLTQIRGELCYIGLRHLSGDKYEIMIYGGMDLRLQRVVEISIEESSRWFRVMPVLDGEEIVMIMGEDWIYSYGMSDGILQGRIRVGYESVSPHKLLPYINSLVELV